MKYNLHLHHPHLHDHLERVASKVDPGCADQGRQLVCRHQGKPAVRNIIKGTSNSKRAKNNKETAAKNTKGANLK